MNPKFRNEFFELYSKFFRISDSKLQIFPSFRIPGFVFFIETFYFDSLRQLDRVNQSEILWNFFKQRSVSMHQIQMSFIFTLVRVRWIWRISHPFSYSFCCLANPVLYQVLSYLWSYLNSELACHFHHKCITKTKMRFQSGAFGANTNFSERPVIGQSWLHNFFMKTHLWEYWFITGTTYDPLKKGGFSFFQHFKFV